MFRDCSGGPVEGETGLSALSFRIVTSFVVAQTLCLNMSARIVDVYGFISSIVQIDMRFVFETFSRGHSVYI